MHGFAPQGTLSMKLIVTLLGLALILVAVMYFKMPAEQLPVFFPGHEAGVTRVHMTHGLVTGLAGIVLVALGQYMRRR
jgi:hypothetical protein